MALIKCPDCQNQVSSRAAFCRHCGAPIAGSAGAGTPLATTQLTAKRLKIQILFSALAFWIGIIWVFVGFAGEGETSPVAIILFLVGIVWLIITKMRIWWHHK